MFQPSSPVFVSYISDDGTFYVQLTEGRGFDKLRKLTERVTKQVEKVGTWITGHMSSLLGPFGPRAAVKGLL